MADDKQQEDRPKHYSLQTDSDGCFNIYSCDRKIDWADISESETLRNIMKSIRGKLKISEDNQGKVSMAIAAETLSERMVVNAEARCKRTTEALLEPHIFARYACPA